MRIADVMTRDLPTVEPGSSVRDAAREMSNRGVRALPVCEGTRLVGIVTDWDLVRALADDANAGNRMLAEFMSTDLAAAPPDATFAEAAELMADRRVPPPRGREGGQGAGGVHPGVPWARAGGAARCP